MQFGQPPLPPAVKSTAARNGGRSNQSQIRSLDDMIRRKLRTGSNLHSGCAKKRTTNQNAIKKTQSPLLLAHPGNRPDTAKRAPGSRL
jgi:hypothetical protein